ncbi:MAG: ParB/RepB/Spo0J family partition protein [Desulfobacteraceae bacterium]|nr:ParB/RepB/Spo0J family partition protein [Desulfobacteraceae bacterium]
MARREAQKSADTPNKKRKKLALGRGLDSLIPTVDEFEPTSKPSDKQKYFQCDIDIIQPNKYQPRRSFKDEELSELAESIKAQGIIQPIIVRRADVGYEIVAGERRLRAAKRAGLDRVPVLIKELSDTQMLEMSIVENIQRENLNPVEESEAYYRLINEFGITQEQAAERVGKSRSAVANFLRIRQLSELIKQSIINNELSMGHARALLSLESAAQQDAAWRTVVSRKLSVRDTEALIKKLKTGKEPVDKKPQDSLDRHLTGVTDDLSRHFGTKVQIKRRGKKGKLEIEFYNDDDLNRLIELLTPLH